MGSFYLIQYYESFAQVTYSIIVIPYDNIIDIIDK